MDGERKRANGLCNVRWERRRERRIIETIEKFLCSSPLISNKILDRSCNEFGGDELSIVLDRNRTEKVDEIADVDTMEMHISDELRKSLKHGSVSREFLLECREIDGGRSIVDRDTEFVECLCTICL